MTVPFMRAYTELLVQTCHKRGAHAIGGMAAFIPNRRDPEVTEKALAKVREDKERESRDGFDGTWVAHPDLVPVASRSSTRSWATRRPRRPGCVTTCRCGGGAAGPACRGRQRHRGRRPRQHPGGARLPRRVAGRDRRRGDRQPHGGRGDSRNRPLAALAVANPRPVPIEQYATIRDEELARLGGATEAVSRTPGTCSTTSSSTTSSPNS